MKIAIHHRAGSFSDRWITYSQEHHISYKIVNAYDSDILEQVQDCDIFMWHHHHGDYRDLLFAKELLTVIERSGKVVYPNSSTSWHFDDKIAQKYLFESLGIAHPQTMIFYEKEKALAYLQSATFPLVFKLRGGAGSANVSILRNLSSAKDAIHKSFGKGYRSSNYLSSAKTAFDLALQGKASYLRAAKYFAMYLFPGLFGLNLLPVHKGYILLQEFIPNKGYDIRVVVIGDRAFAIKRSVHKNDFRASGSGLIEYSKELFPDSLISQSFDIAQKLNMQSCALDFVKDTRIDSYALIEVSYGFSHTGYISCKGYWTRDLLWHQESFDSREWIVEQVIDEYNNFIGSPDLRLE